MAHLHMSHNTHGTCMCVHASECRWVQHAPNNALSHMAIMCGNHNIMIGNTNNTWWWWQHIDVKCVKKKHGNAGGCVVWQQLDHETTNDVMAQCAIYAAKHHPVCAG